MQIYINSHRREVADKTTVAQLLDELQLDNRYLAVECNEDLVPRAAHANQQLAAGDRLEIVTLVGGG